MYKRQFQTYKVTVSTADGTFALMEKDDLDYGVIGNPTKASKEKISFLSALYTLA